MCSASVATTRRYCVPRTAVHVARPRTLYVAVLALCRWVAQCDGADVTFGPLPTSRTLTPGWQMPIYCGLDSASPATRSLDSCLASKSANIGCSLLLLDNQCFGNSLLARHDSLVQSWSQVSLSGSPWTLSAPSTSTSRILEYNVRSSAFFARVTYGHCGSQQTSRFQWRRGTAYTFSWRSW